MAEVIGYCVKCKEKRPMKDVQQTKNKKGVPMSKGKCTTCGTNMSRMGKA